MNYKVSILGSAVDGKENTVNVAKNLGRVLSTHSITLLTGAFEGMPYIVAKEFVKSGKKVIGYSAATTKKGQHLLTPENNMKLYQKIWYVPKKIEKIYDLPTRRKYRNVFLTSACDAGFIVSGRWGTLNEFTCLFDMGKVVGILTGTGGVADELPMLIKKIIKNSKAVICIHSDPKILVSMVIARLEKRLSQIK